MSKPRTLRSRLVLIVVALMAAVGAVVATVSVALLNEYLVGRVDTGLPLAASRAEAGFKELVTRAGPVQIDPEFGASGQASGTISAMIYGNFIVAGYPDETGAARQLDSTQLQRLGSVPLDGKPHTVYLGRDLGDYRVLSREYGVTDSSGVTEEFILLTGLPLGPVKAVVAQFATVFALLTAAGVAVAAAIATFVVGYALRPLNRVASTAASVAKLPLDRGDVDISVRVPDRYADAATEVGQVGSALNRLLSHVGSALAARQRSEDKVRRFVADASHELRTPLASIRGYSELTRRTQHELSPEVQHNLSRIESEAVRMTTLVEDLLLLARLDSQPELRLEEVDLSLLAVDAVGDAHAAGPDHEWLVELPEEPAVVLGDEPRLRQVFANLLANARTHTPAATTVTTSLACVGEQVILEVSDNGPGIPKEQQAALFERFTRGDDSRTRATGSTGLGLSIVKAVAEAHGGNVTLSSEPGSTTFTVTLPSAAALESTDEP